MQTTGIVGQIAHCLNCRLYDILTTFVRMPHTPSQFRATANQAFTLLACIIGPTPFYIQAFPLVFEYIPCHIQDKPRKTDQLPQVPFAK
jgi:hypothetical protein